MCCMALVGNQSRVIPSAVQCQWELRTSEQVRCMALMAADELNIQEPVVSKIFHTPNKIGR